MPLDQHDAVGRDVTRARSQERGTLLVGVDEVAHQQDAREPSTEVEGLDPRTDGFRAAHVGEHRRRFVDRDDGMTQS